MRRWLKFEILDLNAILEAIEKKNEMEKRQLQKEQQRKDSIAELQKMQEGKDTFKSFFMSKEGKVNKITDLTNSITNSEKDIECLGLLHKIVVLQLNQAAIQFFKRDKFTTYNHTVNLYSVKNIENFDMKLGIYKKIAGLTNQVETIFEGVGIEQIEVKDSGVAGMVNFAN